MEKTNAGIVCQQFNETIGGWIDGLGHYTGEMLCRKPSPGSWSIGQVYVHIITDTPWFIEQAKACLQSSTNSEKEMHGNAKAMFANNSFPDMLIEGPPSNKRVRQPRSKDELFRGLLAIKDEVNRLHLMFDVSETTGKTRHPGLGYFNAPEWLKFAEMHIRHHLRQKKRIDEKLLYV